MKAVSGEGAEWMGAGCVPRSDDCDADRVLAVSHGLGVRESGTSGRRGRDLDSEANKSEATLAPTIDSLELG